MIAGLNGWEVWGACECDLEDLGLNSENIVHTVPQQCSTAEFGHNVSSYIVMTSNNTKLNQMKSNEPLPVTQPELPPTVLTNARMVWHFNLNMLHSYFTIWYF